MKKHFLDRLSNQIEELKTGGLFKEERIIASPQDSHIKVVGKGQCINLCANNYLGLANHPLLLEAAASSYQSYGFGLASVRFICGTQTIHKQLETRLSHFFRMEDTILYSSCFDANGGLFEPLFGEEDAIISDALNHASIIDGIRLCKAKRFRYQHNAMDDLKQKLQDASNCRYRVIATDGVFSMDGTIANLKAICDLADEYDAFVMVDDCHAAGFIGHSGRGTPEYCGVEGRIDFLTGTLGKAMGGASGGYITAAKPVVELLRQRSRPYLFSNTLAPSIATATLKALDLIESGGELRERLHANSRRFRQSMSQLGFNLLPGSHPIIPVMIGDAAMAQRFAGRMMDFGVYVIGFCYPVVPEGKARIRTQMSAAHSEADIDMAVAAFASVGHELYRT